MHENTVVAIAGAAMLLVTGCIRARESTTMGKTARDAQGQRESERADSRPLRRRDYSFAWWPNGFRKEKTDTSANVFCVESGRYGFALDMADFRQARLGRIDGPGYRSASRTGSRPLTSLPPAKLTIELEHQGTVYRAVSCRAGRTRDARDAILLESGRFAQRYRFPGLQFEGPGGKILETDSTLELVAWPSSLTFSLKIAPDCAYENGPCPGITGAGRAIRGQPVDVPHRPELDPQVFTLEAWVRIPRKLSVHNRHHWLIGKNANEWQDGNFGLLLNRETVTAIMNIGGGRDNVHRVDKSHALPPDRWYHLAMSYDNSTLRFYVDGRPAGSTKVGKVRIPGNGALRIGGRPDGHGKPVHALFDDLRLWNRALREDEVMAHAKAPDRFGQSGLSWRMTFDEGTERGQGPPAPNLDGARMRVCLNEWTIDKQVSGRWAFGANKEFVLHCPVDDEAWRNAPIEFAAKGRKGMAYRTQYDSGVGAYVVDVPEFERDWKTGYTDIRDYDEVELRIDNGSLDRHYVPVLFDVKKPANITGQTPILCDAEGRPTGIPVQLSKNWHHGAYS
ncbi:MAG: LamG domain-containing protein, partial [Candidatus Brocadiae bacterium]|nr:LamG domain-containing protein [Candidatus Brocadiia bacterium]